MKILPSDSGDGAATAQRARWGTFDGMRALAALGVIFIHIGLVANYQVTNSVVRGQDLCAGVVPFFLVTAFYFAARREIKADSLWKPYLTARASRLLVPFCFWGALYIALRVLLYLKSGQLAELHELESDPLALFFNGGAVALYFLPLLFVGLVELRFLAPLLRRVSLPLLAWCGLFSLALQWSIDLSGNEFSAGGGRAFLPWTAHLDQLSLFPHLNSILISRVLLVILSHSLRCAPLICGAFLACRLNLAASSGAVKRLLIFAALGYTLLFTGLSYAHLPYTTWLCLADGAGICGLLLALSLTNAVPATPLTSTLGAFTFGIYLVHQAVLTVFRLVLGRHLPQPLSFPMAVLLSLAAFSISYGLTALAARSGSFSRRVFAIESN